MSVVDSVEDVETLHVRLLTNFQKIEDVSLTPQINGILRGQYGESLNEHFGSISRHVMSNEKELTEQISNSLQTEENLHEEWLLAVAQFYLRYKRIQNSEKYMNAAQQTAGLRLKLEGAMGKRTKFQQEAKAQLYLDVAIDKEIYPFRSCPDLPKPLELNDELRLERIEFVEVKERPHLGSIEDSIVLTKCFHLLLSQPKDKLTDEEIIPYLNNVIEYTKNWPLLMSALHQRCIMELRDRRTVERAMAQAENLMELLNHAVPPIYNRIDFFFTSGMKPIWTYKQILADAMLSLGLVKGALDLYLKLHLWEDVIVCYTILELKHKAAEIIRQEIKKKETVKLWCLLGDATQEIEHYVTAWKLSNEKSSRAQRHWGFHYFAKQLYQEAIPHLKLSVELNNIQENVWIRLGFAALQVEDWKLAATAYRSYCNLEPSTFEAWNNLAKAYIKMGEKERAWRSLQDAIKCNYDRWEIWDNLMLVSIDVGHFLEAIRCYHRILDLKGQHIDIQILVILTKAVRENKVDYDGNPSRKLLPKVLELFGRLTAITLTNSEIWRLYAELTIINNTELDAQKAAQYLQRSYRAAISDSRWAETIKGTVTVLDLCIQLGEAYLNCYTNVSIGQKRSMLGSAKLCLQSVLTRVKNYDLIQQEEVRERVDSLDKLFEAINTEFEKVKAT
ncbi:tetratricopeptide repeat protein 27 isoform X2 [Venturia canescens]|uniref:tetratricopeptide repeat protein 27 isoform X2 n=1 Tax=Venturia canescens TaxID=32260 RepID=UPI001C9BF995|nr:tetratricopeptide repeat protein 27 isoform X2 [Venturia canescens]